MTKRSSIPEDQLLAYFEGALSPDAAHEVAGRLDGDTDACAKLAEWERQNAAIRTLYAPVAEEPVPERLLAMTRPRPQGDGLPLLRIAAVLGLLAVGGTGGWLAAELRPEGRAPRALAEAAIGAHETYAVEVIHPVEVAADEAEHLTGWVSKRLGHDIAAPDFAAHGFRLMGGRVLPGEAGPAALFMYDNDAGRRISLYVAPAAMGGETAFQFSQQDGMQSFYWLDGDLSYAVVGDVPRETLRRIALAAYDQLI